MGRSGRHTTSVDSRIRQSGQFVAVGEGERLRVDTVAKPGRPWAVSKYVAEVTIAASAQDLRAPHAIADVRVFDDVLFGDGLKEAWPAGALV
jgi:hypothetical protein